MPAPIESADPVADLRAAAVAPGALVGLATAPGGGTGFATHGACWWSAAQVTEVAARLAGDLGVRLVWWAAGRTGEPARELVAAGCGRRPPGTSRRRTGWCTAGSSPIPVSCGRSTA
ncbi:MAG TPA: hypothetical protein VEX40_02520, partial [Mycobacterium sp.]|nr:hypothetical protein [Mycobacterium sp.]